MHLTLELKSILRNGNAIVSPQYCCCVITYSNAPPWLRTDLDVNRLSIFFHLLVQANQSECWTKGKRFKLLITFLEDQSSKQLFKAVCILYIRMYMYSLYIHRPSPGKIIRCGFVFIHLKITMWVEELLHTVPFKLSDSSSIFHTQSWYKPVGDLSLQCVAKWQHMKTRCLPEWCPSQSHSSMAGLMWGHLNLWSLWSHHSHQFSVSLYHQRSK